MTTKAASFTRGRANISSGAAAYLLDNGHLFRPSEVANRKPGFQGPAASGRFQEFDWDGNLVWDFEYHSEKRLPHHDAIKLPNGNVLAICWERIDEKEAVASGPPARDREGFSPPARLPGRDQAHGQEDGRDRLGMAKLGSPDPGPRQNQAQLRQSFRTPRAVRCELHSRRGRPGRENDGDQGRPRQAPHPGLRRQHRGSRDASDREEGRGTKRRHKDEDRKPIQGRPKKDQTRAPRKNPDWMHVNAVAYNADLDQIALSSPQFHEIWIIDHSTTTEEAKGHTGGRWGKGGDILYRWGNPRAYRNGTSLDQRLFGQHNIQWIAKGLSGEGHLLVFNNGGGRKPEEYSSVDEFVPPTDKDGNYIRPKRGPFGPAKPLWSYTAPNKKDFYSWFISGAQRLPNGNTLINAGAVGVVFEVTPGNETVWKFSNPFKTACERTTHWRWTQPKALRGGRQRQPRQLGMTPDQRKKLDEIDKELIARLDKILTAEQIKSFAEPNPSDAADLAKRPPGEYLTVFDRSTPKVTDAQRKELQALQKDFSPKIAEILTDAQKTRLRIRGLQETPNGRALPDVGGPPRPGNTLFRATRYALNHPAFAGRMLKPGKTLVELQQELDRPQPKKDTNPAKLKTVGVSR